MSGDRRKEIVRHLSMDDLDRLLVASTDEKPTERLIFLKQLYKGATLEDAADDAGRSSGTGTRWGQRWNRGSLGLLMSNFGGGGPRSSMKHSNNDCLSCFVTVNHGRNKRYGTSSTKHSTPPSTQPIFQSFLKSLDSLTLPHEQNDPHAQTMPRNPSY